MKKSSKAEIAIATLNLATALVLLIKGLLLGK